MQYMPVFRRSQVQHATGIAPSVRIKGSKCPDIEKFSDLSVQIGYYKVGGTAPWI